MERCNGGGPPPCKVGCKGGCCEDADDPFERACGILIQSFSNNRIECQSKQEVVMIQTTKAMNESINQPQQTNVLPFFRPLFAKVCPLAVCVCFCVLAGGQSKTRLGRRGFSRANFVKARARTEISGRTRAYVHFPKLMFWPIFCQSAIVTLGFFRYPANLQNFNGRF